MMIIIHGLPLSVKYQDIKKLVSDECHISDFIMDSLMMDDDGLKRMKIGLADADEGALVIRRLNGFCLNGHRLRVVPVVKQQTKKPPMQQQSAPTQNYNMPNTQMQGGYQPNNQWNQPGPGPMMQQHGFPVHPMNMQNDMSQQRSQTLRLVDLTSLQSNPMGNNMNQGFAAPMANNNMMPGPQNNQFGGPPNQYNNYAPNKMSQDQMQPNWEMQNEPYKPVPQMQERYDQRPGRPNALLGDRPMDNMGNLDQRRHTNDYNNPNMAPARVSPDRFNNFNKPEPMNRMGPTGPRIVERPISPGRNNFQHAPTGAPRLGPGMERPISPRSGRPLSPRSSMRQVPMGSSRPVSPRSRMRAPSPRSERPSSPISGRPISPRSGRPVSPRSGRPVSPRSAMRQVPMGSGRPVSPRSGMRAVSPRSGRPISPRSGRPISPKSGRPVSPRSAMRQVTMASGRAVSPRSGRPTTTRPDRPMSPRSGMRPVSPRSAMREVSSRSGRPISPRLGRPVSPRSAMRPVQSFGTARAISPRSGRPISPRSSMRPVSPRSGRPLSPRSAMRLSPRPAARPLSPRSAMRQSPPRMRQMSPGRPGMSQMSSRGRMSPNRGMSPRRVSPYGRQMSPSMRKHSPDVISQNMRRMSPNSLRRRSPGSIRRGSPVPSRGRQSSPGYGKAVSPKRSERYSPTSIFNDRSQMKRIMPAYEHISKAPNQAKYSSGPSHPPIIPENHYRNAEDTSAVWKDKEYKMSSARRDLRSRSRSPIRRSPPREYPRHSRPSLAAEAPPPPSWPTFDKKDSKLEDRKESRPRFEEEPNRDRFGPVREDKRDYSSRRGEDSFRSDEYTKRIELPRREDVLRREESFKRHDSHSRYEDMSRERQKRGGESPRRDYERKEPGLRDNFGIRLDEFRLDDDDVRKKTRNYSESDDRYRREEKNIERNHEERHGAEEIDPIFRIRCDKAVTVILNTMIEKYKLNQPRVQYELRSSLMKIVINKYKHDIDMAVDDIVLKFYQHHSSREQEKMIEDVYSVLPGHMSQNKRQKEVSPPKTSEPPKKSRFDVMPDEMQSSVLQGQLNPLMNSQQGFGSSHVNILVNTPASTTSASSKTEHSLFLCKDDFEQFTDYDAKILKDFIVSQIFESIANKGWAPAFILKGLRNNHRYEVSTEDDAAKNWLLNLDFSNFKHFNTLVYTKEQLWYERAAIWLPGHSMYRKIQPLAKLQMQNKYIEGVAIHKWKLVRKILTDKGTRIYVDIPPASARKLEDNKQMLSYELQKVNVFSKSAAVDKVAFDKGISAPSLPENHSLMLDNQVAPLPYLQDAENVVKIGYKDNKPVPPDQAIKIRDWVLGYLYQYLKDPNPIFKTDFVKYGFCRPGFLGIVAENTESENWLLQLQPDSLNGRELKVIGGDENSSIIYRIFFTLPRNELSTDGKKILYKLNQANGHHRGLNFKKWVIKNLVVSKQGDKIMHLSVDLGTMETLRKLNFKLSYYKKIIAIEHNYKDLDQVIKAAHESVEKYDPTNMEIDNDD